MGEIECDEFELEAMRKEDQSWHPCRVSLRSCSPSLSSIIIGFKDFNEENVISEKEEALSRLRYRSSFFEDGECISTEEGEPILAMNKSHSKTLFFDAVIQKVWRLKHSKRVHCRCTFEVKWLCTKWKWDAMTLSSSSIMKLSRKSIHNHPIIIEFVSHFKPLGFFEFHRPLSILEERKTEVDIQGVLEQQIDEISRATKGPRGKFSDDIGSGRSRVKILENELQLPTEIKKIPDKRAFLSPLAARAALASLIHETPQKPAFPTCQVDISIILEPRQKENGSIWETERNLEPVTKERGELKVLKKHGKTKAGKDTNRQVPHILDCTSPLGSPVLKKMPEICPTSMRLTRSKVQKDYKELTDETKNDFLAEERAVVPFVDINPLMRSKAKDNDHSVPTTKQGLVRAEKRDLIPDRIVGCIVEGIVTPMTNKRKKTSNSPINNGTCSTVETGTKDDQGEVPVEGKITKKRRESISKKDGARFSPPLRFSPRFHSHRNSSSSC